jgi:hypothetical protein
MSTSPVTVPSVGATMPDIDLVGPDGHATTLHRVRGEEPAVIYFLRSATCPICLRHARTLVGLAASGELAGDRVLLIVPGGAAEAATVAGRVPGAEAMSWASGDGHARAGLATFLTVQHSGTFAVSAGGAVRYRRTATVPSNSFSGTELLAARTG